MGRRQIDVDRRAARVGVLDDRDGHVVGPGDRELVDQPPRRVRVEDVEIGELLAAVLDDLVPPGALACDAVAGTVLVRVLAVAHRRGELEGQMEGRRQQRSGIGALGSGQTARCGVEGRFALVEPGDDRRVVAGSVGERPPGETLPGVEREPAVAPELFEDGPVVGRIDDDADVLVVLRRGAHHGRTADVDELDRRVGRERVEVAHDEVDEADSQPVERVEVSRLRTVGQDPSVDPRVECLDPAVEHLGRAGHLGDLDVVDARSGEGLGGAPARDELPSEIGESAGEVLEAGLVVDGQQRPHPPTSLADPRPSTAPAASLPRNDRMVAG